MKILIIAHYFPPENNMAMMATLRPLSWAKYWSKAGHDVCVLTTAKNENQKLESELSRNISGSIRIEGVKYLLSRPEIDASSQIKAKNKRFSLYPFLRKILINIRRFIGAGSLFYGSDLWIIPAVRKGLDIYQEWQFDIVVSTFGPPASHMVASTLKKKLNIFWVADYRDLWHGYDFGITRYPFSVIEENIEKYSVSRANLITTISKEFSKNLTQKFKTPAITISNGFEHNHIHTDIISVFPDDKKIRLVHTGSIYPQKRDPTVLFKAINRLQELISELGQKLEIIFYGWDLANLEELINKYKVSNIVKIGGFVNRESSLAIQKHANALIFLDWHNPQVDGVLSGKIFEYMFSGTPILGIGASLETAAGRLIQESGTGILLGDSIEAIADVIKKLINGDSLEYSPKAEILQQYTREALANKMLEEIINHYSIYRNLKS